MFLLVQQYDLNAKFFSVINFLISLFIQGGSLSSQIIVSCGIKFWIMVSSVLVKRFQKKRFGTSGHAPQPA